LEAVGGRYNPRGNLHALSNGAAAGLLAVNLEETIRDYEKLAGEFTNLRDRFRQAKLIAPQKPFPEFEAEVQGLIARLEQARSRILAPPSWSLNRARKIIKSGVYTHDHDLRETPPSSGSG
jgi:hypothetical protein